MLSLKARRHSIATQTLMAPLCPNSKYFVFGVIDYQIKKCCGNESDKESMNITCF